MTKINSRAKGQRGEREVAKLLTERGFKSARGVQYQGGPDSPDINSMDPRLEWVHFEVKLYKESHLLRPATMRDWIIQAEKDAGGKRLPVILHRWNGYKTWMAVILVPNRAPLITTLEAFLEELELWRHSFNVSQSSQPLVSPDKTSVTDALHPGQDIVRSVRKVKP